MLDGVDRVVDLVGPRASALEGATLDGVIAAVRSCDLAALARTDGHFAVMARDGRTVRLARTIGIPLRYFVAKMHHGPFLVVSDRIDRIFGWCREHGIGWQFEPGYTRMVPAHHVVELDQVGCPDPAPRYHRFFEPAAGGGAAVLEAAARTYAARALEVTRRWVAAAPADAPIGVAFSGGVDSTAVLLLARRAAADLGRNPSLVRPFTLDLGGGSDAEQAKLSVDRLGIRDTWEVIHGSAECCNLHDAIALIEDYHPLDVECAAVSLCLLRGIRERYPALTYLLDGDGGDENLKSYPLEDSDLTLSSVLRNPLLYQEGWGIDAVKHSVVYSGGLSRGYVRTFAPAAATGFEAFSPFTARSVIAAAMALPFDELADGRAERLSSLKQEVVAAGIRSVLGLDMPVFPKRRFQDGAVAASRPRPAKAWCRAVFDGQWQARLRDADAGQASGVEIPDLSIAH
jgi:asparagine synthase (glutamine-hydrolysing)